MKYKVRKIIIAMCVLIFISNFYLSIDLIIINYLILIITKYLCQETF